MRWTARAARVAARARHTPLVLFLALIASRIHAQKPVAEIRVPRVSVAPRIDGVLDDAAWDSAAVVANWVQTFPGDNVPAPAKTRVYFAYDRNALYIALRMDAGKAGVRYVMHERDQVGAQGQDAIYTNIDTFDDRRRAYLFAVNPVGVQGDALVIEGTDGVLKGWDTVFETAGKVVGDEWMVEIAIPFKSLRFPDRAEQRWGISMNRGYGGSRMSDSPWPIDRNLACKLCQMAVLTGIHDIARSSGLEINPEVLVRSEAERVTVGGAFDRKPVAANFGLNLKYGITSNLTANVTINPDFSQVEADAGQLEINNRFALFYEEKRPFFLEAADLFETGIVQAGMGSTPVKLIHTRRILDPSGGAKLSGKVGKLSIGVIGALDAARDYTLRPLVGLPDPSVIDAFDGRQVRNVLARAKLDAFADGYVGGSATLRQFGDGTSAAASTDARVRFGSNTTLRFFAATSRTTAADFVGPARRRLLQLLGDTAGQRTLAALPVDALAQNGEHRNGTAVHAQLDYQSRHWSGGAAVVDITPRFETQIGFTPRTDQIGYSGALSYLHQSVHALEKLQPGITYQRIYNHNRNAVGSLGALTDTRFEPYLSFGLPRSTDVRIAYSKSFLLYRNRTFDGMGRWTISAGSNAFKILRVSSTTSFGDDVIFADAIYSGAPVAATSILSNVTLTFRPFPPLRFELSTSGSSISRAPTVGQSQGLYARSIVPRLKAQYQHTVRLGFRAIAQYRDEAYYNNVRVLGASRSGLVGELLATYQLDAGRTVYLGWTQIGAGDLAHPYEWNRRGAVAKVSYTWRP